MSKVAKLKNALLDTLIDQVENGIAVTDAETGEVTRLPAPAQLLSVAAKVVKDFHDEVDLAQREPRVGALSATLARYADKTQPSTARN